MNAFSLFVSFTVVALLLLTSGVESFHKHKHIKKHIKLYKGFKFIKKAKFVPIILPVPIKHKGYW